MNIINPTEKRVLLYCRQNAMFTPGDHVVVGVSGGADSVCLLFVLYSLREILHITLEVVHINHGIRAEAIQDAAYVETLCEKLQIPFQLVEADVPSLAKKWHLSEEEAGRKVRYDAFAERLNAVPNRGAGKIAVAHNAGDRAETMLFHLFRGTGLTGLIGIRPVRGRVVRPLLCLERKEIEGYLDKRGIGYCTDCTNSYDIYIRNRIRHHILPYAEKEISAGSCRNMCRTAQMLAQTEEYLAVQTALFEQKVLLERQAAKVRLDVRLFCEEHPVIQKRLLYTLLNELSPARKDITSAHVEGVLALCVNEGNRDLNLPYGICVRRRYDELSLFREDIRQGEKSLESWQELLVDPSKLGPESSCFCLPGCGELQFRLLSGEEMKKNIPLSQCTKWFDYDKIKGSLSIRTRRTGDYLTIHAGAGQGTVRKKLKDYLIAEKLPREQRDHIPLLAEESHVLWAVGYRISEAYKINKDTKRILEVSFFPEQPAEEFL